MKGHHRVARYGPSATLMQGLTVNSKTENNRQAMDNVKQNNYCV